jgi:hypothetical protein
MVAAGGRLVARPGLTPMDGALSCGLELDHQSASAHAVLYQNDRRNVRTVTCRVISSPSVSTSLVSFMLTPSPADQTAGAE